MLNLTTPFTPMLFMGEEWGASTPWQFFTSHPEPDLGRATAEGRIAEFARMGWDPATVPDPQDPATYERSKLDWDEVTSGDHARLLALHRDLIALRRRLPELVDPSFLATTAQADDAAGTLLVHRGRTTVAANLGAAEATLPVAGELLLATTDAVRAADGSVVLPPDTAAVLRR